MMFRRRIANMIRSRMGNQRGAILVLMAMSLTVLMGMAAFAVDYGWIAWNRLEVRKAAEAAALAGVVYMPLPGSATFGVGAEPFDTAVEVAGQAGYVHGAGGVVVTPEETPSPNQVKVTVRDTVNTFFMQVFVPGPITVSGSAIAEQLPPLKIGSDESNLGNDGLSGSEKFWVAINGRRENKRDGDPFTTHCLNSNNCGGTPNPQQRNPSYYYAVEVPPGYEGQSLRVEIFDGTHKDRGTTVETGDVNNDNDFKLRMKLYPPDSTPSNWTDNKANNGNSTVCSKTFWQYDSHPTRSATWGVNEWKPLTPSGCGGATAGIYVLEISMDDAGPDRDSNSQFSIKAKVGGSTGIASVYGLGAMGIYINAASSTPTFKIVRLDQIYAGAELVLSLYDVGDISGGGTGDVRFTGAFAGIDCEVQVRRDSGESGVVSYRPDSSGPYNGLGAGTCGVPVKGAGISYNGDWVDFKFDIPPDYTCSGASCWGTVQFNFSGAPPQDTTAWSAAINGTPIHLEP